MTRTVDRDDRSVDAPAADAPDRSDKQRTKGGWLSAGALQVRRVQAALLAVAAGVLVGALVVLAVGENPLTVYASLFRGAFDRYGLPSTLSRAVPIVGAGLAAAVAFRAGFITLGVEGQMVLGGLSAALTTIALADAGVTPSRSAIAFVVTGSPLRDSSA
jgi:simple sugar transport system permease protein